MILDADEDTILSPYDDVHMLPLNVVRAFCMIHDIYVHSKADLI